MMLRSVRAAPATVNLTRRIEGLAGSFRERYGGALPTRIDIFFQRIDAMDGLVKSLENRITRDFAYLIGGGTVISLIWLVCFSMTHPDLEYDKLPSIAYFLLFGIAYVVGFVVQELFSFLPGFSTTLSIEKWKCSYKCCLAWLYLRYTREEWKEYEGYKIVDAYKRIWQCDEPTRMLIERTATLKHLGTCIGPCFLVSGLLALAGKLWLIAIMLILTGGFLWLVGRLKTMQQIAYLHEGR